MPVYTYTIVSEDILHIHAPITLASIPEGYRPYAMVADLLDANGTHIKDDKRNDLGFIAIPNDSRRTRIIAMEDVKETPNRLLLESVYGFHKSSKIAEYLISSNKQMAHGVKLIVERY